MFPTDEIRDPRKNSILNIIMKKSETKRDVVDYYATVDTNRSANYLKPAGVRQRGNIIYILGI